MALIEALIAFLVVGVGMLSIISVQSTLRYNSEVAKQRSEAVRLAQEELEGLRAFATMVPTGGVQDYQDITNQAEARVIDVEVTNTTYSILRSIVDVPDAHYKVARVTVSWRDRRADPDTAAANQEVSLQSTIAGIDPLLSGILGIAPAAKPVREPKGRHRFIPPWARDLGDGRSVLKPVAAGGVAWVFDNLNGSITRCTVAFGTTTASLTAEQLVDCDAVRGYLLAGYVAFTDMSPATEADAEVPLGTALDVRMTVDVTAGDGRPASCFDNSEAAKAEGLHAVSFLCVVYPTAAGVWSGTLTAVPDEDFVFGLTAADRRLCRYSADYDGDGTLENEEHPAVYTDVDGGLVNQNFLVVPGDSPCPTDVAADPSTGDFINANTVQVAPALP